MRTTLTLIALAALSGCAHTDAWTPTDTALLVTSSVVLAADARSTANISTTPGVHETGPIARRVLGSQPDSRETYMYFATVAVSNYFITRALPKKWRPWWQGAVIAHHGYAVGGNCELDLCR